MTHAKLLTELLQAVQLPQQLAICKCAAHTTGTDPVSRGNAFADKIAKEAAQGQIPTFMMADDLKGWCNDTILQEMQQQSPKSEQDLWIKKKKKKEQY